MNIKTIDEEAIDGGNSVVLDHKIRRNFLAYIISSKSIILNAHDSLCGCLYCQWNNGFRTMANITIFESGGGMPRKTMPIESW